MEPHEPHEPHEPQEPHEAHEPQGSPGGEAAPGPGGGPTAPDVGGGSSESEGTGLAPNVAGALAYLVGPITGIIFLLLEKRNRFVRFHAAQSIGIFVAFIAVGLAFSLASTILGAIPLVGWIIAILFFFVSLIIGLLGLALWLFLMYKAYSGEEWEFPWVGSQARRTILGNG